MRVTIKIKRFNPEKDSKPHWRKYPVRPNLPTACSMR